MPGSLGTSNHAKDETMKIKAWVQMGCERREVAWEMSEAEIEMAGNDLEGFIEKQVLDWIECRFGWGWSCDLITNDFGFGEDDSSVASKFTNEVLNPRTERKLVNPQAGLLEDSRVARRLSLQ